MAKKLIQKRMMINGSIQMQTIEIEVPEVKILKPSTVEDLALEAEEKVPDGIYTPEELNEVVLAAEESIEELKESGELDSIPLAKASVMVMEEVPVKKVVKKKRTKKKVVKKSDA